MLLGNCRCARDIAACTSAAAASISRLRSNCSTIELLPSVLVALISLTPGMVSNCLTSGVVTDVAMVCGEAPDSDEETLIVGKSTFGRAATGSRRKPASPASTRPMARSVVATGRLIQKFGIIGRQPFPAEYWRPDCRPRRPCRKIARPRTGRRQVRIDPR